MLFQVLLILLLLEEEPVDGTMLASVPAVVVVVVAVLEEFPLIEIGHEVAVPAPEDQKYQKLKNY
jgi:hypothetical protein